MVNFCDAGLARCDENVSDDQLVIRLYKTQIAQDGPHSHARLYQHGEACRRGNLSDVWPCGVGSISGWPPRSVFVRLTTQLARSNKLPQKRLRPVCPIRQTPPVARHVERLLVPGHRCGEGSHRMCDSADRALMIERARQPLRDEGMALAQIASRKDFANGPPSTRAREWTTTSPTP